MTIERLTTSHVVLRTEERFVSRHLKGVGKEAEFTQESAGWYIILENHVGLYVGQLDPKVPAGTQITIAIEIPR